MAGLPPEHIIVRTPRESRSKFCISGATSSLAWCSKSYTEPEVRIRYISKCTRCNASNTIDVWQELAVVTTPDIKVGRRGSKLAICKSF